MRDSSWDTGAGHTPNQNPEPSWRRGPPGRDHLHPEEVVLLEMVLEGMPEVRERLDSM